HAIAITWHDLNGRLMPLFFHVHHESDSSSILAARRDPSECTGALRAFGSNVLGGFAFNVLSVKGLHGASNFAAMCFESRAPCSVSPVAPCGVRPKARWGVSPRARCSARSEAL